MVKISLANNSQITKFTIIFYQNFPVYDSICSALFLDQLVMKHRGLATVLLMGGDIYIGSLSAGQIGCKNLDDLNF